jgi:hypothetical protein
VGGGARWLAYGVCLHCGRRGYGTEGSMVAGAEPERSRSGARLGGVGLAAAGGEHAGRKVARSHFERSHVCFGTGGAMVGVFRFGSCYNCDSLSRSRDDAIWLHWHICGIRVQRHDCARSSVGQGRFERGEPTGCCKGVFTGVVHRQATWGNRAELVTARRFTCVCALCAADGGGRGQRESCRIRWVAEGLEL